MLTKTLTALSLAFLIVVGVKGAANWRSTADRPEVALGKLRAELALHTPAKPLTVSEERAIEDARTLARNGNFKVAISVLGPFALKGYANAQLPIGTMYFRGAELPVDHRQAAGWWALAARQGQPDAIHLLRLAAQSGDTNAQELYRTVDATTSRTALGKTAAKPTIDDFVNATRGLSFNQLAAVMQMAGPGMRDPRVQAQYTLNPLSQQVIDPALGGVKSSTALSDAIARAQNASALAESSFPMRSSQLLSTTTAFPSLTGALPRDQYEQVGRYVGSSGARYMYDLSKPWDALMYSVNPGAQVNDSVNPSVMIDRGLGQFGGGATR